jgi:hypothetical protein
MHGTGKTIDALHFRCGTDKRATLEQLLGPPTAIVAIGDAEFCLGYRLAVPAQSAEDLKKCGEILHFAARLTGSHPNGPIARETCRRISHSPENKANFDTMWRALHGPALLDALRAYSDETPAAAEPKPRANDGQPPHDIASRASSLSPNQRQTSPITRRHLLPRLVQD